MALFGAAVKINGRDMSYEELFPFSMAATETRITPEELRSLLLDQDYEKYKTITIEEVEDIRDKVSNPYDVRHQPYLAEYQTVYSEAMEFKEIWMRKYGGALRRERELHSKIKLMDQDDFTAVLLAKLWTFLENEDISKIIIHLRACRGLSDSMPQMSAREQLQLPSRAFDRAKRLWNELYVRALFPKEAVSDAWKKAFEEALGREITWILGTEHPFLMENFVNNQI
ncbi:MAG: hypothetical protein Q9186_000688 [Xanthomendoza sp. 1 TL-2023]